MAVSMAMVLGDVSPPSAEVGSDQPSTRAQSANWVPLKGRFRVAGTWGHRGGHSFPAIDFVIPAGTSVPVYAAGPGTVLAASGDCPDTTEQGAHTDCNGGRGNYVEIGHPDGRRSRYLHLRSGSVAVEAGEHVCLGCQIGRSGWSGNVSPTGPEGGHLHYEELQGFEIVDPGPMRAEHRTRRVSYPGAGRSWKQAGRRGLIVRNSGFPRVGTEHVVYCFGWAATRVGTSGNDEIFGTPGPDIIVGAGGNDTIYGLDSADRLCGNAGDDVLDGGPEPDLLDGGDGGDTCYEGGEGEQSEGMSTVVRCEGPPFMLTVSVGCCLRFVTSQPAGISCPPDCNEQYLPDTVVVLTLSTGSSSWEGCDTGQGTNQGQSCSVVMTEDRLVRVG